MRHLRDDDPSSNAASSELKSLAFASVLEMLICVADENVELLSRYFPDPGSPDVAELNV
jgi:hypothetical protein